MTQELLTFNQVLTQAKNPHLLLGNGFSMAYDEKRFSFTTLLESAIRDDIIKEESHLYKAFQKLATADFESVMKSLDETEKIMEVYEGDVILREEIKKDTNNLKRYLVAVVTNNHPEKCTEISFEQKISCINFLKKFNKIYTLNYDFLLYWATMQDQSTQFTDGFGNTEDSIHEGFVVYKNSGSFNVHYLHGALHFFDAGNEIIKKTYTNSGVNLLTQIQESLDSGIYPVFISEGNSEQKKAKIIHNAYLNHCYKSFRSLGTHKKREKTIEGDIVILGTYLKKNDTHILDGLLENNIKNIFIGVSSSSSVDYIFRRIDEYNSDKESGLQKNIVLYNYKTVNVWTND